MMQAWGYRTQQKNFLVVADRAGRVATAWDAKATGLKILSKSPVPARMLTKAAQERADEAIATRLVRDLRPAQHAAAEAREPRHHQVGTKDPQAPAQAQRATLLNNLLFKSARCGTLSYFCFCSFHTARPAPSGAVLLAPGGMAEPSNGRIAGFSAAILVHLVWTF